MSNHKLRYLSAITRILLQVDNRSNSPVIKYKRDFSVTLSHTTLIRKQSKNIGRPHDFPTYSELKDTLSILGFVFQAYWDGQHETIKYRGNFVGSVSDRLED